MKFVKNRLHESKKMSIDIGSRLYAVLHLQCCECRRVNLERFAAAVLKMSRTFCHIRLSSLFSLSRATTLGPTTATTYSQHTAQRNRKTVDDRRTCRGGRNFDSAKQQWSEERENSFPASKVISTSRVGLFTHTHTQSVSHTPSRMPSRPHQLDDRMEIFVLMSKSWIQWTFFFSLY